MSKIPWDFLTNAGSSQCLIWTYRGKLPNSSDFLRGDVLPPEHVEMEELIASCRKILSKIMNCDSVASASSNHRGNFKKSSRRNKSKKPPKFPFIPLMDHLSWESWREFIAKIKGRHHSGTFDSFLKQLSETFATKDEKSPLSFPGSEFSELVGELIDDLEADADADDEEEGFDEEVETTVHADEADEDANNSTSESVVADAKSFPSSVSDALSSFSASSYSEFSLTVQSQFPQITAEFSTPTADLCMGTDKQFLSNGAQSSFSSSPFPAIPASSSGSLASPFSSAPFSTISPTSFPYPSYSLSITSLELRHLRSLPYFHHLGGPILFSASHSTKVWRGGNGESRRVHKAERWAADIATRLALAMKSRLGFVGSLMVWNPALIPGKADKQRLDPNYLLADQFDQCPWHDFVHRWRAEHSNIFESSSSQSPSSSTVPYFGRPLFHIDIHGKHDHDTPNVLDLGMAPMLDYWPRQFNTTHPDSQLLSTTGNPRPSTISFAHHLHESFAAALESALAPKFSVDKNPTLCGLWERHFTDESASSLSTLTEPILPKQASFPNSQLSLFSYVHESSSASSSSTSPSFDTKKSAFHHPQQRSRHTSTHQSVLMGIPAAQFEIPRTLRHALMATFSYASSSSAMNSISSFSSSSSSSSSSSLSSSSSSSPSSSSSSSPSSSPPPPSRKVSSSNRRFSKGENRSDGSSSTNHRADVNYVNFVDRKLSRSEVQIKSYQEFQNVKDDSDDYDSDNADIDDGANDNDNDLDQFTPTPASSVLLERLADAIANTYRDVIVPMMMKEMQQQQLQYNNRS